MKDRKDVPISSERYLESDAHTAWVETGRGRATALPLVLCIPLAAEDSQ